MVPTLDVFASSRNAVTEKFFTSRENAFSQPRTDNVLWICPPFHQLDVIIDKIIEDHAMGIIVIPTWKSQAWFHRLEDISVNSWTLPKDETVLRLPDGTPIPHHKAKCFFKWFCSTRLKPGFQGHRTADKALF